MKYNISDLDTLFNDFYKYVNNIINYIIDNEYLYDYLLLCNYKDLYNKQIANSPLTIILGGGAYIQYKNIFKDYKIDVKNKITSYDYDISMALKHNLEHYEIKKIKCIINDIIIDVLSEYKFKNINSNHFTITCLINDSRIHFRVNCDIAVNYKYEYHIFELSLWFNGQISDNFTINDFRRINLYLYQKNDIYYYLLPLDLLVKTTLYAIVDFFELRNFQKCVKYLERVKYINNIYNIYINMDNKPNIINDILSDYKNKIKRKYKMINDYPYNISYLLKDINNNGIIKCIYKNLRNSNKTIEKDIIKYKNICKDEKQYIDSDNSSIDNIK